MERVNVLHKPQFCHFEWDDRALLVFVRSRQLALSNIAHHPPRTTSVSKRTSCRSVCMGVVMHFQVVLVAPGKVCVQIQLYSAS
jgi:hypothetical protein